jgi:peptidoglycan/LPS O-acetylase OafA/YrhL
MPTPASVADSKFRLDSIDALRGIAALMVAGYHIWGHYGVYPFPSTGVVPWTHNADLFSYLVSPLRWGYLGVSLFLVLSGFCIHLPFARKRASTGSYDFNTKKFFLRRLWRLYPAYGVSVIATFVLLSLTARRTNLLADPAPTLGDLISHLTLTHGYFDRYFYGINMVYWSLALEFQLYLAYPIFLYLFRKVGISRSLLVLIVISIVWRYVMLTVFGYQLISVSWTGPYAPMGFLFARMPEWLFGAWLAEWFASGAHIKASRWTMSGAAVISLFGAIVSSLYVSLWSLTDILFGLGFAFVIAAAIIPRRSEKPVTRTYRWLVWSGTISYSIYLFHLQLSWFGNAWIREIHGDVLPFILRTLVLAISIPVIAFIFRMVERSFMSAPKPGSRFYGLYNWLERLLGIKSDAVIAVQLGGTPS